MAIVKGLRRCGANRFPSAVLYRLRVIGRNRSLQPVAPWPDGDGCHCGGSPLYNPPLFKTIGI